MFFLFLVSAMTKLIASRLKAIKEFLIWILNSQINTVLLYLMRPMDIEYTPIL